LLYVKRSLTLALLLFADGWRVMTL
jgi:hypothetical protein